MTGNIQFIKDTDVSPELDASLIETLSTCFNDQPVFKERRYFKECPPYRWLIKEDKKVIAHAALHEKVIKVNNQEVRIAGIAEVCVLPAYRGRGYVKALLQLMETFMIEQKFEFAMLFGETYVYGSSGYFNIENEIQYTDHKTNQIKIEKNICAMVKVLAGKVWPAGLVDLNGPTF